MSALFAADGTRLADILTHEIEDYSKSVSIGRLGSVLRDEVIVDEFKIYYAALSDAVCLKPGERCRLALPGGDVVGEVFRFHCLFTNEQGKSGHCVIGVIVNTRTPPER